MDRLLFATFLVIAFLIFFPMRHRFAWCRRLLFGVYYKSALDSYEFWANDGKPGWHPEGRGAVVAFTLFHNLVMADLMAMYPHVCAALLDDLSRIEPGFSRFLAEYRAYRRRVDEVPA